MKVRTVTYEEARIESRQYHGERFRCGVTIEVGDDENAMKVALYAQAFVHSALGYKPDEQLAAMNSYKEYEVPFP